MRRFAAFFMIIFFASILAGPSMFMLSIEGGKIYTEKLSLNHIIKTAYSSWTKNSQDLQSSLEPCRIFWHRHIQLTGCAIPEKRVVFAGPDVYAGIDFLPPSVVFNTLPATLSRKQFDSIGCLKLPIPTLLQTSVLLV